MRNVEQLQTELREHLHSLERSGVVGLSATFQPAEWAAIVPRLDPDELLTLFEWLPDDDAATVLATLDPHTAADVLQIIGPVQAAAALDEIGEGKRVDQVSLSILELKKAGSCEEKKVVVVKLKGLGDVRALPALRALGGRRLGPLRFGGADTRCMRQELAAAIAALDDKGEKDEKEGPQPARKTRRGRGR